MIAGPAQRSPPPSSPLARPAPSGGGQLLPQLDALRGVAILAVFVQHLGDRFAPFVEARIEARVPAAIVPWLLTVFHHAWWGVDLFFVLSGFSLAQAYVRAFDRGAEPTPPALFLRRRALRILPAFYAALAVMIATHPSWILRPGFPAALAANLTLLQGYVQPGGLVFIGAAWSLSTEAHFYLLLPWMARPLLAKAPSSPARRLLVLAAICLFTWPCAPPFTRISSTPACTLPCSKTASDAGSRAASINSPSAPSPPPCTPISSAPRAPR